jgi:hypothetical protein
MEQVKHQRDHNRNLHFALERKVEDNEGALFTAIDRLDKIDGGDEGDYALTDTVRNLGIMHNKTTIDIMNLEKRLDVLEEAAGPRAPEAAEEEAAP